MRDAVDGAQVALINATTGETMLKYSVDNAQDLNHVQLVDNDKTGYLSSRMTNSFIKLNMETGKTEWTLGGDEGDFTMVDINGESYDKGKSLFFGQHNAE